MIGTLLGADQDRDLFLGTRANEDAVRRTDLSQYRIVAFATHGLGRGDLDGLDQPALALSAPEVVGGAGDGLLTMEKILRLRMDADWIVLSACQSGAGSTEDDEALSGLGRAFFYAGSRALLVTAWPIETTSARALTTLIFQRYTADPTVSRAMALRSAMLAVLDEGAAIDGRSGIVRFTYAHPVFWAPFIVVGDGGR